MSDQCPLYPPKADIAESDWNVSFVPELADLGTASMLLCRYEDPNNVKVMQSSEEGTHGRD